MKLFLLTLKLNPAEHIDYGYCAILMERYSTLQYVAFTYEEDNQST